MHSILYLFCKNVSQIYATIKMTYLNKVVGKVFPSLIFFHLYIAEAFCNTAL